MSPGAMEPGVRVGMLASEPRAEKQLRESGEADSPSLGHEQGERLLGRALIWAVGWAPLCLRQRHS